MVNVYIGIGSNIEPEKHFTLAYQLLKVAYPTIEFSRTFQSKSIGFTGDDFYNSVAKFSVASNKDKSLVNLELVLKTIKSIESQLGRMRGDKKFSARVIDIDILLFDDLICDAPVELPRAEIIENAYVLWPLSELAPNLQHPILKKTYTELWDQFDKKTQSLIAI